MYCRRITNQTLNTYTLRLSYLYTRAETMECVCTFHKRGLFCVEYSHFDVFWELICIVSNREQ